MSILRARIVSQHNLKPMGNLHPHGTGATPMTMPIAKVSYGRGSVLLPGNELAYAAQTGTVAYEEMHVIWSADNGAPYAASAHGGPWAQVVPAGHP